MGMTEYERERDAQIARNKARMAELNLRFIASKLARPKAPAAPRRAPLPRQPADAPVRSSARRAGRPADYAAGLADSDEEGVPRRSIEYDFEGATTSGRKAVERVAGRMRSSNEAWAGSRMHELPPPPEGVRRNMSCHCCTQCVASWRGNVRAQRARSAPPYMPDTPAMPRDPLCARAASITCAHSLTHSRTHTPRGTSSR